MVRSWYSIWYEPEPHETVAFISEARIASIGGCPPGQWSPSHINQGNAILSRWCRQNCREPGQPVTVKGQTGWAFRHPEDALIFKLAWG